MSGGVSWTTQAYCGVTSFFTSQTYDECIEEETSEQPAEAHEELTADDVPGNGMAQQAADAITARHQRMNQIMNLR